MAQTSIAPSMKQIGRFACVVVIGLAAMVGAKADEIEYTSQQKMACMPDAFRLCSDAIPDASAVRTCMIANKSKLSSGCQAMFRS